jgi:microcystin-dependent protein
MTDPFLAEMRVFPFTFAPRGWALCDGQILSISQNTALFSLLGTTYGGDGRVTFGLPNLQGSVPVHAGASGGPGLSQRFLGETGGSDTVTLLSSEMPAHSHNVTAQTVDQGDNRIPSPSLNLGNTQIYATSDPNSGATLDANALPPVGGSQPHNNLMPYLTLNFNIALQGIFPQRP